MEFLHRHGRKEIARRPSKILRASQISPGEANQRRERFEGTESRERQQRRLAETAQQPSSSRGLRVGVCRRIVTLDLKDAD